MNALKIKLVKENDKPTEKQMNEYRGFSDISVSHKSIDDWYCLLKKAQGNLSLYISGVLDYMIDNSSFLSDSLFCEYVYIINLDSNMLEIYEGFNKNKNAPGRYADTDNKDGYYGVKLFQELSLDVITKFTDDDINKFVEYLNAKEDKDKTVEEIKSDSILRTVRNLMTIIR